jgi:hypothetical protein
MYTERALVTLVKQITERLVAVEPHTWISLPEVKAELGKGCPRPPPNPSPKPMASPSSHAPKKITAIAKFLIVVLFLDGRPQQSEGGGVLPFTSSISATRRVSLELDSLSKQDRAMRRMEETTHQPQERMKKMERPRERDAKEEMKEDMAVI